MDLIDRQAAIDALLGITAMRNTIPLDSAIFNLKKLPSAQPQSTMGQVTDAVQSTNDCISRHDAIDAIKALWDGAPTAQHVSAMFDCEDAIQTLPSAEPEIIHCRECQHWKQDELVDKCGLLDCYADADCYCAWAVRERRQDG